MNQLRQGDVLLVRVSRVPARAKPVRRRGARIILAEGEATGHAHAIESGTAQLLEDTFGGRFIVVTRREQLVHEEHDSIAVEPGVYRVLTQREYASSPMAGRWTRKVRD